MIKYETDRLILREASMEDDAFIFDLLNNPTWIEFIGDRQIHSLGDAQMYIQNQLVRSYQINGFGMYIMEQKSSETPIGLCGFLKREQLDHVDIGFAILPKFAGNGYTFEAAEKIMTASNLSTIYGITSDKNETSKKLLRKLGMVHIKNFKFGKYNGDSMLFSTGKE
ncbi:GNAT family N-acetyltransferase [Portibacter marinus]|uniref:GNAT family N-acetyltransferase n=1 Tax=Portibacter marinus TaxID=2898660 RepID=UPI001F2589AA|nr:GNAT family N-acetyltransferase [Portibacter marinus]